MDSLLKFKLELTSWRCDDGLIGHQHCLFQQLLASSHWWYKGHVHPKTVPPINVSYSQNQAYILKPFKLVEFRAAVLVTCKDWSKTHWLGPSHSFSSVQWLQPMQGRRALPLFYSALPKPLSFYVNSVSYSKNPVHGSHIDKSAS